VLSGEYDDHYVLEADEWKMDRCVFRRSWSIARPLSDDTAVEQ